MVARDGGEEGDGDSGRAASGDGGVADGGGGDSAGKGRRVGAGVFFEGSGGLPGDEVYCRSYRVGPGAEGFLEREAKLGGRGLTLISCGRSPMQRILVDWAGLEEFSYHLAEGFSELFELAESLLRQLVRRCELIAAGPGRYVSLLENLTAETWGPERFGRFHMPVYEKIMPILHAGGKKVCAHFDGKLACLAEQVARSGLDGIESLTPPPEGDMSYAEARAAFDGQFIWGNINVSQYGLPAEELKGLVRKLVREGSPDGRLLGLEISEDLPGNWKMAILAVMEELEKC